MRFATRLAAIVLLSAVLVPSAAFAQQASITGVVRDSSGAVLPGVTVEASSPVLIEQSRSVVTDGAGQYRIVDLRAGTYVVTFSLAGFTTFRREGVELSATFIATINADLRVAAVAETVTVSGESPIVDVQSSSTVRTIDNAVFAGIPSSRGYAAVTVLMPGISAQGADVGGVKGDAFSVFQAHGGRRNEGQVQVNGLSAGWLGMGVSGYVPEVGSAQEISFQVTGGLGEAATGGPQMNLIPREGGNSFSGTMFFNYAGDGWQGDNLSDEQRALGLREINKLVKTWDINPTFGGPIKRDRLWFFATARHFYTENTVAGIFLNRNAGDATKWTYDPGNEQAIFDNVTKNASLRLTWQASPRNKVSGWWDEQVTCQRCDGKGGVSFASPLTMGSLSPEADGGNDNPIRLAQAIWTSPVNNRVLLEASFGLGPWAMFGGNELPNNNRDLIPVIEAAGAVPGIEYRGQGRGRWARNYGKMYTYSGSLSYIAGAHRFKVGGRQQRTEAAFVPYYNNYRLAYNFSNTLPVTLTMYANHAADNPFDMNTTAFYAQDHWTAGRLTLQGGLRFEHIGSYYPESSFAVDRFLPVALTFPAQDADVSAKDINPRVGAAYDLFGTRQDVGQVQPGAVSDRRQRVRRVRIAPTAGEPSRHLHQPQLERPHLPDRRSAAWQLLTRLRSAEPGDQRRVRALDQPELRQVHRLHDVRPPGSQRLERSGVQLGSQRRRPARDRAAHIVGGHVHPAELGQPDGDRQPRRHRSGLRQIQPHGPVRFAPAGRRRLHACRASTT